MKDPQSHDGALRRILNDYTSNVVSAHNFGANYVPTELVDDTVAAIIELVGRDIIGDDEWLEDGLPKLNRAIEANNQLRADQRRRLGEL